MRCVLEYVALKTIDLVVFFPPSFKQFFGLPTCTLSSGHSSIFFSFYVLSTDEITKHPNNADF